MNMDHGGNNNDNGGGDVAMQAAGGLNGCRYKGVVPQPNGHWGAQIYANHQRIWLGTFKTEHDAATAYDSASMKLRPGDAFRNLPADATMLALEAEFQTHFADDAVLAMIKDGSYPAKLTEFYRAWHHHPNDPEPHHRERLGGGSDHMYEYRAHFEKELTPSDVGKLNRLVIPKKYAVKFFPNVEREDGGSSLSETADPELDFRDMTTGADWRFRYCYWKSSQSYVFTKGWNKFVKAKGLKTKDVAAFYACRTRPKPGSSEEATDVYLIDVKYCEPEAGGADGAGTSRGAVEEEEGIDVDGGGERNEGQDENVDQVEGGGERRGIKLFGVEIM